MDEICAAEGCGKAAAVGLGQPPEWLCLEHFEEAMRKSRSLIDRIEGMLLQAEDA